MNEHERIAELIEAPSGKPWLRDWIRDWEPAPCPPRPARLIVQSDCVPVEQVAPRRRWFRT